MSVKGFFSIPGHRLTFEEDGIADAEVVITSEQSEGRYSIIRSRWLSNFQVPPHFHKTHSETFYVLEGQVEWTVGGETHTLNPGDAIYIPPKAVHSVRVVGGRDMLMLMIYEPGGYEVQTDYKMNYTPEELQDPEIKARIRKMGDFNPVD